MFYPQSVDEVSRPGLAVLDDQLRALQLRLEMRRQREARLGSVQDEGRLAGVCGDVLETLGQDGNDSLL